MKMPSFDELRKLADSNPEQLEALRQQMIEETINNAPPAFQRRLRGLQFQVDMERRRARNPMDSCIRVSKMMHDHLYQMRQTINGAEVDTRSALAGFTSALPSNQAIMEATSVKTTINPNSSTVVPFPQLANN